MKEYNYSKIYNTYNNNLLDKLRDFKINDDLALWVPNGRRHYTKCYQSN